MEGLLYRLALPIPVARSLDGALRRGLAERAHFAVSLVKTASGWTATPTSPMLGAILRYAIQAFCIDVGGVHDEEALERLLGRPDDEL